MKKLALAAALSASALAFSAQAALADYTLNIMHINDWHSRIESNNKYESTCSVEDETEGNCFGGAARLVTAVRDYRAAHEGDNVLFLNAGDNFQGSLFYSTYKGAVEAEFLNIMKPDVMTIGNHEFDDGEEGLATFFDAVEFPIISANVRADMQSALADKVKPSIVLEVGGEKIGIVGAVANDTAELSSPGEHVTIEEDVATITEAVKELSRQGVSKIIALTHVGYPRDMAAIARIPGVDVVVGGHSHTLLSNTVEGAGGPYPTWVDNPLGYKVPIVQAGSYSKYLGDLSVTFSDIGIVKEASGEPILLDASVEPDAEVVARVEELKAPIAEAMNEVVASTTGPIDGSRDSCRAQECEMGNLVTDAMLDRVKDQGVQFAITNGGGLRASIDEGDVTMGEVVTVLPFQNTLATFDLKGSDVMASLEGGLSQVEDGAGRFPQVSGLRYTFDRSVAPGEGRVTSVEVNEGGEWVPIDPDKTYLIATNNFMRGGGDGYALFASSAKNAYDYGPGLEQVVADYLAANRPYAPYTDGRISEGKAMMEEMEKADEAMAEKPAEEVAAAETETAGSGTSIIGTKYTVVAGDNLWDIAADQLGSGAKWPEIAEANGLSRPYLLSIGQELNLPSN
ncbi:MAG: 5'-nucleotidase C-terminal domain-containing protein [Rhizobiaceae bacterium]